MILVIGSILTLSELMLLMLDFYKIYQKKYNQTITISLIIQCLVLIKLTLVILLL